MSYPRISSFKTAGELRTYLAETGIDLKLDDHLQVGADAPLAQPYRLANGFTIGNRFCILPMEGWDGTADGRPSELTFRRWRRFGMSGAKLIWGGEAAAVRHDGRANPNQLLVSEKTLRDLAALREGLIAAHPGRTDDLLIGLQLTHSGRFAKPNDKKRGEPRILYHHPFLDRRLGIGPDHPVLTDDEIKRLIDDFIAAAQLAKRAGFAFVDIKHCHGYLGHEFLSAVDRPGLYGGSFENRTRFLREIAAGIRTSVPGLDIGVRVSAFDFIPYRKGAGDVGEPEPLAGKYRFAFGGDGTGLGIDLTEPKQFMDLLASLGIRMVCITAGSPYYNPHLTRPATFPPSDGYLPPEDPLWRRRATDQGHGGSQATPPRPDGGRLGLFLPAGVAAERRTARRARGRRRFRRPGENGAAVSRRCARTSSPDGLCRPNASAGRSATARPAREADWSRAVIRSTIITESAPKPRSSRR